MRDGVRGALPVLPAARAVLTPLHPQRLESEGMLKALEHAITKGTTEYGVGDLSIPGLRHFLYKSRAQVQVTAPRYEEPYDDANECRRYVVFCLFGRSGADGDKADHAVPNAARRDTRQVGAGGHAEAAVHPHGAGERARMGASVSHDRALRRSFMRGCRSRSRSSCIWRCRRWCRRARW